MQSEYLTRILRCEEEILEEILLGVVRVFTI